MSEPQRPPYNPPERTATCWSCQQATPQMQSHHGVWFCCECGKAQQQSQKGQAPA